MPIHVLVTWPYWYLAVNNERNRSFESNPIVVLNMHVVDQAAMNSRENDFYS